MRKLSKSGLAYGCHHISQSAVQVKIPCLLSHWYLRMIENCSIFPAKTCAPDPIATSLVKECINILIALITNKISWSFKKGCFLNSLRHSPSQKKASLDRNGLKNYRPVSNLCFISKLIQKVMAKKNKYSLVSSIDSYSVKWKIGLRDDHLSLSLRSYGLPLRVGPSHRTAVLSGHPSSYVFVCSWDHIQGIHVPRRFTH